MPSLAVSHSRDSVATDFEDQVREVIRRNEPLQMVSLFSFLTEAPRHEVTGTVWRLVDQGDLEMSLQKGLSLRKP